MTLNVIHDFDIAKYRSLLAQAFDVRGEVYAKNNVIFYDFTIDNVRFRQKIIICVFSAKT